MCGIAGIYREVDVVAVRRMVDALQHRGPDDSGVYFSSDVTLGHARLSIIDTSSSGHQPMQSEDGNVTVVFNGEIYNFQEERQRLEGFGHSFSSHSDTEVLLKLYLQYDEKFLKYLRGIFAVAIYDQRKGAGQSKLILARDRFGIKPLLYTVVGNRIVFASELKALLGSGLIPRRIDPEALRTLITFGSVYQPRTLVTDVQALPPAHYLVATPSSVKVKRYWQYAVDRVEGLREAPYEEQRQVVYDALAKSVIRQLVADVPVGAFLSGGVDSSFIVSLMAREIGYQVKTFSVGFTGGRREDDESDDAEAIAKHFGTDHTRVMVDHNQAQMHLLSFVRGLDQPSVDGMNSFFVSKAAGQSVRVSLSGTGGDELFAGYPWFNGMLAYQDSDAISIPWWRRVVQAVRFVPRESEFLNAYGRLYHCFGPEATTHLLHPELKSSEAGKASRFVSMRHDLESLDELPTAPTLNRVSALCMNAYTLSQLLRDIDVCSMAHSLEVRVPFLDEEIADIAFSLPSEALLAPNRKLGGRTYRESGVKRVIIDAATECLPDWFFTCRGKRGFSLPFGEWLRGPLREVLEDNLSPSKIEKTGLFQVDSVTAVKREFLSGKRPWNQPWLLMIIQIWMQEVFASMD